MELRHGSRSKCVERYCELAHKTVDQLRKISTPCFDDHQVKPQDLEIAEEMSEFCSQIVFLRHLDVAPPESKVNDVCLLSSVSTVATGSNTLGIAVGPCQFIVDQLLAKADVIRAMHERVRLCQDPQTEFALPRESLVVSRINLTLSVHGHNLARETGRRNLRRG